MNVKDRMKLIAREHPKRTYNLVLCSDINTSSVFGQVW